MASPDSGQDLTNPIAVPDRLADIELGSVPRSDEIVNESQQLLEQEHPKLVEAKRAADPKLVEAKRAADRKVVDDIEAELEVYDEKESLLAGQYRAEERERTERERKVRERKVRERKVQEAELPPAQEAELPPAQAQARVLPLIPEAQSAPALPEDRLFKEVKNLVYIDTSPILKKALEDWARKEALLTNRVERKTTRVAHLKNEVYQLIGFFSVFQGVVLTAVSQANLLHCNNKWSPILLSVLASIVTIAAIAQKLLQISSFQKTIHTDSLALKDVVHRGRELRSEGPKFVFAKYISSDKEKEPQQNYFWIYSCAVLFFLGVFTVAFPISYWRILCHPDPCPCSTTPPLT